MQNAIGPELVKEVFSRVRAAGTMVALLNPPVLGKVASLGSEAAYRLILLRDSLVLGYFGLFWEHVPEKTGKTLKNLWKAGVLPLTKLSERSMVKGGTVL